MNNGNLDDGVCYTILGFTYTYMPTAYTQISISTNGYVYIGINSECSLITRPSPFNILIGLNRDLNLNRNGAIYFQAINSGTLFDTATSNLNLLYPSIVQTNGFLVTYDDVKPYGSVSGAVASFQVFLLIDGSSSSSPYAVFSYTSCLSGLAVLAFSGINYKNAGTLIERYIINQCTSSNVGVTGVWASRVETYSLGKLFKVNY